MDTSFPNLIALLQAHSDSFARILDLNRADYLSSSGERNNDVFFILDGAIHAYILNDGEEQSIRFGYSGSMMVSLDSFYSGNPSRLFLQAIRKSKVAVFSKEAIESILAISEDYRSLYRDALEALVLQQHEREIDLLCSSPAERYERVLKRSPNLFQEVPAKYIASYLRMTPETLSRLRNS